MRLLFALNQAQPLVSPFLEIKVKDESSVQTGPVGALVGALVPVGLGDFVG
jgi:hypothetical protein